MQPESYVCIISSLNPSEILISNYRVFYFTERSPTAESLQWIIFTLSIVQPESCLCILGVTE